MTHGRRGNARRGRYERSFKRRGRARRRAELRQGGDEMPIITRVLREERARRIRRAEKEDAQTQAQTQDDNETAENRSTE